jgi:hypothetical protein
MFESASCYYPVELVEVRSRLRLASHMVKHTLEIQGFVESAVADDAGLLVQRCVAFVAA